MLKIKKLIFYIFQFFVFFCFLLKLPLFAGITARNLSLAVAIVTLCLRARELKQIFKLINKNTNIAVIYLFIICTIICICSLPVIRIGSTQYMEPWFFFYEYANVMVFMLYTVIVFRDVSEFLKIYIPIFLVQAIAIFMAVVNSSVRLCLYSNFYVGDDRFARTIEEGTRIVGIGVYASSGSIICSTICLFLVYAVLKDKINSYLFILLYLIMILMTIFIGRTGVLVEILVLAYYFIAGRLSLKKILFIVLPLIIVPIMIVSLVSYMDVSGADVLLEWAFGFLDKEQIQGTASVVAYKFPDFDEHMIFGTGVLRGTTAYGTFVWSDSGYVKTYCAIGIVGAFLYYFAYLKLFSIPRFKNAPKIIYRYVLLVISIAFIIEYKEPYMHRCIFNWAIMSILLFEAKDIKFKEISLK